MRKRVEVYDYARAIAIILMVIRHSIIQKPIDMYELGWGGVAHFIAEFHMQLFFVLAGAVYSNKKGYLKFVSEKAKRIALPFVVWGLISIFLHSFEFASTLTINGTTNVLDSIGSLFLYADKYWFLYVIFEIFLIYPLINKFLKTDVAKTIVCIALVVIKLFIKLPEIFCMDKLIYYIVFFFIGDIFLKKVKWDDADQYIKNPLFYILLGIITVIEVFYHICTIDFIEIVSAYLNPLLLIILVFYVAVFISKMKRVSKIKTILSECSKYSLQIYIFNFYTITIGRYLVCNLAGIEIPVVILLLLSISSVILILVACKIIERNRLPALLCGLHYRKKE